MNIEDAPGWGPGERASDTPIAGKLGDAIAFLKNLPHTRWVLTAIIPDGAPQTVTFSQGQEDAGIKWLTKWNGFRNLYFSLAEPFIDHVSKLKKEHIDRVWCLHCDIDRRDDETREAAKARILAEVAKYPQRPSFIIDSGNGVQVIWIIEPIDLPPIEMIGQVAYDHARAPIVEQIEGRNRGLALALGGDLPTCNIDRVFRLPGATNLPNKKKRDKGWDACPTRLIEATGHVYKLEDFEYAAPKGAPAPKTNAQKIDLGNLPDIDVDDLRVPRRMKDVIRTGQDPQTPYPSRSHAVFGAIRSMLMAQHTPEEIVAILLSRDLKISASILEKPNPRHEARRQVEHCLDKPPPGESPNEAQEEAPAPGETKTEKPTEPPPPKAKQNRFVPIFINDLVLDDEPSYLIDGLLPCGPCFGVVFGPPGSLKTFLLMDALLHLPQGKPYCGRSVLQKAVVYVTSEAVVGVKRRLIAMRQHHGIEGQNIPFGLVSVMPNLGTGEADRKELIDGIEAAMKPFNIEVGAIAIDTVRRAIPGKSENDQKDMSVFVENCEAIARHFNCIVPGIHHSPRSDDTRGSGSNSIDGASVFMWGVKRQEKELKAVATVARMKDGKDDDVTWSFDVKPVEIGQYPNGASIMSCHVEARAFDAATDTPASKQPQKSERQERQGLIAMRNAIIEALDSYGQEITIPRSTTKVRAAPLEAVRREFCARYVPDTSEPAEAVNVTARQFRREVDRLPKGFFLCKISGAGWIYKL